MRVTSEVRDVVERTVRHYVALANNFWDNRGVYVDMPHIRYDLKGKVAGKATLGSYGMCFITLNPGLLINNLKDYIDNTIPHEVAHIVARRVYGRVKPHGNEWKHVMAVFGVKAERCHEYDMNAPGVVKRQMKRYDFGCGCEGHVHHISARKLTSIQKGNRYRCIKCKQTIHHPVYAPRIRPAPIGNILFWDKEGNMKAL